MSQVAGVQTWRLYRFDTDLTCPRCGGRHRLYIGKSNEPLRRVLEHAKDQPWWPYVTGWTVDPRVFGSDADVRAAEKAAILSERPFGNKEHNGANPCRIDFGQRGSRPARPASAPVRVSRPPRSWSRRQQRAAAWAAGWAGLAVALTVAAVLLLQVAVWPATEVGAAGSAGLLAAGWVSSLPKRRRRALFRWAVGVAVAAGVVWLVFAQHATEAGAR